MISLLYPCICFDPVGGGGGGKYVAGGGAADAGNGGGRGSISTTEEIFLNPSIPPCDFNSISPGCEAAANLSSILGSYANFISNVQNGYNQGGCQWFLSRIAHWQNQLATINYGPGMIARKQAKIDYCNCMYNTCCASPIIYGCMDDGNMPNTYQNNQGGLGSVLPPSTANPNGVAAINYYPAATQDNGTCIYPDPAKGCNDPLANNYMNPANYPPTTSFLDCDPNTANVMGSAAYLASGPYGDTSCCEYAPGIEYNFREGKAQSSIMPNTSGGGNYAWFNSLNTGILEISSFDAVNQIYSRGLGPQYCGYHPTQGYGYGVHFYIS